MCGIAGIAGRAGTPPHLTDTQVAAMRDALAHRGPDGAGLLRRGSVVLAHRRLSVIDPTPAGAQPMVADDDTARECSARDGEGVAHAPGRARYALVYNGELYNDAALRAELAPVLAARGQRFRTASDTETLLWALIAWGAEAMPRLRGMYAFAFHDSVEQRLVLGRDPLGIKPLYWWSGDAGREPTLAFASEVRALLRHPLVPTRPDAAALSAYCTTIRTTLGERTLFQGVRAVRPGEWLVFDLRQGAGGADHGVASSPLSPARVRWRWGGGALLARATIDALRGSSDDDAERALRAIVDDSIAAHLRSDVPVCCLLSGGLDSSIIAARSSPRVPALRTYCAGANPAPRDTGGDDAPDAAASPDFAMAHLVARALGSDHTEAVVTREHFAQRWPEIVRQYALPLSTPNEVAINAVARAVRARGDVVALSGEGADELFAGYDAALAQSAAFEAGLDARLRAGSDLGAGDAARGAYLDAATEFLLQWGAWVPPEAKSAVLAPDLLRAGEGDAFLRTELRETFAGALDEARDEMQDRADGARAGSPGAPRDEVERLRPYLGVQRRVNLAGLLLRLDQATMLESVEGRTPLADALVAHAALALPMRRAFAPATTDAPARSKIALRRAFAADLPREVVERPKASFPLPFQQWVADQVPAFRASPAARELFTGAAIAAVCEQPQRAWQFAWPMMNLALWADGVF